MPLCMLMLQVYKVDGSESRQLQKRYGFRTVPMFLMFYQGKLVYASNSIRTKHEFIDIVRRSLASGRRGDFLAEGFSFQGNDNSMLDGITHDMSLLRAF